MTLHMEDVHGIATKIYEYEIEAGMLCSAIEKVPIDIIRLEIPAVRFKLSVESKAATKSQLNLKRR